MNLEFTQLVKITMLYRLNDLEMDSYMLLPKKKQEQGCPNYQQCVVSYYY